MTETRRREVVQVVVQAFVQYVKQCLSSYAMPRFITQMSVTGTMKNEQGIKPRRWTTSM